MPVGDKSLGAVNNVVVALLFRAGLDADHVARVRTGDRDVSRDTGLAEYYSGDPEVIATDDTAGASAVRPSGRLDA